MNALKESIEHWEKNLTAVSITEVDVSGQSCALCEKYFNSPKGRCCGCPVALRTKATLCSGTPYMDAFDAYIKWASFVKSKLHGLPGHGSVEKYRDEFRVHAKAEVEFLRSLEN